MSKGRREAISDTLMLLGAPILLGSLFLPWSHQFSRPFLARFGNSAALQGIPRDPTAWQLYSVADVLLVLVAGSLLGVALRGTRNVRVALTLALGISIAFTVRAMTVPPTNGADIFDSALGHYAANSPGSGPGETLALLALTLGAAGVLLSFTAD